LHDNIKFKQGKYLELSEGYHYQLMSLSFNGTANVWESRRMEKKIWKMTAVLVVAIVTALAIAPMAAGAPAFDVEKAIKNLQRTADSIKVDTTDISQQLDQATESGSDSFLLSAEDTYQNLPFMWEGEHKLTITIMWEEYSSTGGILGLGYNLGAMTSELPAIGAEVPVIISQPGTPVTFVVVTFGTPYLLYHGSGIAHVWLSYFAEQ
jgi:hypothetical protein